jgi:hypothetical protein
MSTYEHLKSKGIDLISNDSLRRHITAIYSERYYFIEKMELEYDNQYQLNTVVPEINAKVVIEDTLQIGRPVALESLYDDNTFKGMLRMHIKIRAQMLSRYDGLRENLEDLIDHIKAELNERL